jgi:hypothetical protein
LRWMPGIRRPSTSRSICWPILKTYLVRLSVCGDGRVISRYSGTPGRSSPAAQVDRVIPREVGDFFHHLRAVGNQATHESDGTHAEALTALKIARELGIWFYRSFGGGKSFSPGAFVPPLIRPPQLSRRSVPGKRVPGSRVEGRSTLACALPGVPPPRSTVRSKSFIFKGN